MATTANYDAQAEKHSKRVQWMVEIDLDRCSNRYTLDSCTANDEGDGSRCYFSFHTCQDPANFVNVARTYRFCLNDVPWPDAAVPVWPLLKKVVFVPQEIKFKQLFVYPEKLKLSFMLDSLPLAIDADKPLHNTGRVGEFWRNLFARNRNYAGRAVRIFRGFSPLDGSSFAIADFSQIGPTYLLRGATFNKKEITVTAESPLAELDRREVPFTISKDNTASEEIDTSETVIDVVDASEFPDPADFTRNKIYIRVTGEEISSSTEVEERMEVTSVDTALNQLTVVRRPIGGLAQDFKTGAKVENVAFFGTEVITSEAVLQDGQDPKNVIDVLQDLMEWAGIAAADVDTTQFDLIKEQFWPRDNILRLLSKPKTVAKYMLELREIRNIAIFIDDDGKWSCEMIAPQSDPPLLTEDHLIEGSSAVTEDDERRLTRVGIYWNPIDPDKGQDPEDFNFGSIEINSDLEAANLFGDKKERTIVDAWLAKNTSTADVRNIARSMITFRRYGERKIQFKLELSQNTVNVGDLVAIQNGVVLDQFGNKQVLNCFITKKSDPARGVTKYEAIDVNFSGKYFRIGPDKMAETYDAASDTDKTYGYWSDSVQQRLGTVEDEGYILF